MGGRQLLLQLADGYTMSLKSEKSKVKVDFGNVFLSKILKNVDTYLAFVL